MNLEAGEVIVLDNDKEYICVSVIEKDGEIYIFLVSNFKPLEVRFARQIIDGDNLSLEIINDQQQKIELLQLFQQNADIPI